MSLWDYLFGESSPEAKVDYAPPLSQYPTPTDAQAARVAGFGYGLPYEGYLEGHAQRVLGQESGSVAPSGRRLLSFAPTSGVGHYLSDLTSAVDDPSRSKNYDPNSMESANYYTQAALAANRIPIAALGFDPRRSVMDVKAGETNIAGAYQPNQDAVYAVKSYPSALVHEFIHRGFEMLRKDPELKEHFRNLPPEELAVRYLMATQAGDPEAESGDVGQRQRAAGLYAFRESMMSRAHQRALDALTKAAERKIKERQPMGPRAKGGRVGDKVHTVMHEFKHGELHSGSKTGPKVKSRKQAIAIALSEAGQSRKRKGGMVNRQGGGSVDPDKYAADTVYNAMVKRGVTHLSDNEGNLTPLREGIYGPRPPLDIRPPAQRINRQMGGFAPFDVNDPTMPTQALPGLGIASQRLGGMEDFGIHGQGHGFGRGLTPGLRGQDPGALPQTVFPPDRSGILADWRQQALQAMSPLATAPGQSAAARAMAPSRQDGGDVPELEGELPPDWRERVATYHDPVGRGVTRGLVGGLAGVGQPLMDVYQGATGQQPGGPWPGIGEALTTFAAPPAVGPASKIGARFLPEAMPAVSSFLKRMAPGAVPTAGVAGLGGLALMGGEAEAGPLTDDQREARRLLKLQADLKEKGESKARLEQADIEAKRRKEEAEIEERRAAAVPGLEAAKIKATSEANIAAQRALQEEEDRKRQAAARMPFREYPGARYLPLAADVVSGLIPYGRRVQQMFAGRRFGREMEPLIGSTAENLSLGTAAGKKAARVPGSQLSGMLEAGPPPGPGLPTKLVSAGLPMEAAMFPQEWDVMNLPPGDPNREAAWHTLTDPETYLTRGASAFPTGALASGIGMVAPVPGTRYLKGQMGRAQGLLSQLPAKRPTPPPRKQDPTSGQFLPDVNRQMGGSTPWWVRSEARNMGHTGPIPSIVGGRSDRHAMSVPGGAYVLPADHVSSLGQGNTSSGFAVLGKMFGMGPYGTQPMRMARGTTMPKAPKVSALGTRGSQFKIPKFAEGGTGEEGGLVDINAAGGEYVIGPEHVRRIGGGNLTRGHRILDAWVKENRKKHIKTLQKLPGPAKS